MGQGESKPASSSPKTQHVFTSETPVRFSHEMIETLQGSPESDSTRAKDLELHIQSRVQKELKRLEEEQNKLLQDLRSKLSSPDETSSSSASSEQQQQPSSQQNNPLSSLIPASLSSSSSQQTSDKLSRTSIQKEIDLLRQRLSERKLREDVVNDRAVEQARGEVVRCLRLNDRRPLDCWKEVEAFKGEVRRLEKEFLGRILE